MDERIPYHMLLLSVDCSGLKQSRLPLWRSFQNKAVFPLNATPATTQHTQESTQESTEQT